MAELALNDSRRLTGPNLLSDSPGAVIDVAFGGPYAERVVAAWREYARTILDAVGWSKEELYSHTFAGGASLLLSAPVDALYAATEINEWAWEATVAALAGESEPDVDTGAGRLRQVIAAERNPRLLALRRAARERGLRFLSDDDLASIGSGNGSITWPVDSLPDPDDVPWHEAHDVPVALVTGSNGKTTTVRLIAAMAQAAGGTPGYSSTDGIFVGAETVDEDDWSGPGGARNVLRDTRVDTAILETARGGMLRRGLGVERAEAAAITNVSADHLGEYGVDSVADIANAKLVVRRALGASGVLVVNADDATLAERAAAVRSPITWFGLDPKAPRLKSHLESGGEASILEDGALVVAVGGRRERIAAVSDIPLTFSGAARYNIANVLAAVPLARALGIPLDAIRSALAEFGGRSAINPGRGNLFELGGVRALVDFAHNPHGMRALAELVTALPAERRLLVLGQAGDRDDASIRALVREALEIPLDRIIIKEMTRYLRGRSEGEVPALIEEELREAGVPGERVRRAEDEIDALRQALDWSRPGDLLILPVHAQREEVLDMLERLSSAAWSPGEKLPQ